jgi:SHS2 domain-containing protein
MTRFEIIEHPADVGFLAYGKTPQELFESAAQALFSLSCAPENIEERVKRELRAEGADIESLLYAWLAAVLAVADSEQLVFRRVEVTQFREAKPGASGEVSGTAYGEDFDRARHEAGTYIKAVTMHQFSVVQTLDGYRARVFLDL